MVKRFVAVMIPMLLAAAATSARAQIVNVQPLVRDTKETEFAAELTGSASIDTGNVQLLLVHGGFFWTWKKGRHQIIHDTSVDVVFSGGFTGDDRFQEEFVTHPRYQLRIHDWLHWESYLQANTNRLKRLEFRGLVGTGPRFTLLQGDRGELAVGAHYMYEHERYHAGSYAEGHDRAGEDFPDNDARQNNHRISSYLTGTARLDERLSFVHTTYYQPRFTAFRDDFRLMTENRLVVDLNDRLALSLTETIVWDTDPPVSVEELDTHTSVEFTFGF